MKLPLLVKKATQQAADCNKHIVSSLNIPDNIHDLKMWVDCKISGTHCEVSNDEAEKFMASIIDAIESAESWAKSCNEWHQAILQD